MCNYSSGVINSSCTCSKLRELTACLCVSAACSDLSASPCTSSAAQPGGRGTPLPLRPTRPWTFYCTAEEEREKCHDISHTDTFSALGGRDSFLYLTGSSFLCLQLYFLLGSSVLGRSMWDCFSMASNKICLLASRRQSRPSNVRSEWDAEEIQRLEKYKRVDERVRLNFNLSNFNF